MCGRYALYSSADDLVEVFRIVNPAVWEPRWNVAPTNLVPVLLRGGEVRTMKWGLVPSWSKDGRPFVNARADGLFDKPSFRSAARKRRCVVLADGFYEWRKEGKQRFPLLCRRRDRRPLAMAGVWEPAREGPPTFAVVTTEANALMAPVHDRMPVLLDAEGVDAWLDGTAEPADLAALLCPCDPADFELVPVSPRVNDVKNEGPELLSPPC